MKNPNQPLAYNLSRAALALGVSRPTMSNMLKDGLIKHQRYNKRVIIPVDAIKEYLHGESK